MPWTRRASAIAWTFGTAMVVYGLFTYLILRQISKHLIRMCGPMTGAGTGGTGGGATPVKYGEYLFGYFVPWWMILFLWIFIPCIVIGIEIFVVLRRWRRDKLGQCIECGYMLRSHRGHCPGCGTRVGVGLPTRRYVLNMPRNA